HEIDLASGRENPRRRRQPQEARLAFALGEHAHQPLADAGRALDRHPLEMVGVHQDRIEIALWRISHRPPAHLLPDRLVAVDIAFALFAFIATKHALLERAVLLELGGAGLHLLLGHVAAAAGAAELQHERERAHARALWSVGRAFREIAD